MFSERGRVREDSMKISSENATSDASAADVNAIRQERNILLYQTSEGDGGYVNAPLMITTILVV